MANETQTRTGTCPTHGAVEGTREVPRVAFPFFVYAFRRLVAARKPFLCPSCGAAVKPL
jgi:hypothetical protein